MLHDVLDKQRCSRWHRISLCIARTSFCSEESYFLPATTRDPWKTFSPSFFSPPPNCRNELIRSINMEPTYIHAGSERLVMQQDSDRYWDVCRKNSRVSRPVEKWQRSSGIFPSLSAGQWDPTQKWSCLVQVSNSILQYFITLTSLSQHNIDAKKSQCLVVKTK